MPLSSCDGKDNDCDGLIDNGPGQLNCPIGQGCRAGRCQIIANLTTPVTIWPGNSSGWSYYDKGDNLDSINPLWRTGYTFQPVRLLMAHIIDLDFDVFLGVERVFGQLELGL